MAHLVEQFDAGETQLTVSLQSPDQLQRAGEFCGTVVGRAVASVRRFGTLARRNAEMVKEEKPLQFLAILAGTAAVAGFGMRVWRSSRNA